MAAYIIRRLIQTVLVLIVLSFVTYAMMGLMPGDPLDIACSANPDCTTENLDQMKEMLGLNDPIYVRYGKWLGGFVQGDLGYSRTYRVPASQILTPRIGNTMILGFLTMLVSLVIAIPLGVFASLKQHSKLDYAINMFAFAGISAPSFWLGLILIIIFSVQLEWLPASGVETIGIDKSNFFAVVMDRAKYLILPVTALSLLTIASWVRYTRSSMLETLRMDYIRTARSKGLTEAEVIRKHALRNALLPVVTVVALSFRLIFSGAVITEKVFAYQGVGSLMFDSIMANDFNVAMCCFLMICLAVLLMNLLADVLYAYLDPRITYQ